MEEEQSLDNPWCQLVSIGDEEEVIPVVGERLSIGRKRGEEEQNTLWGH